MNFSSGNLVLYRSRGAVVNAVGADKIEIRIEGGKTQSVRPKDIVFLHRGPVTALPPAELSEPNCAELLELMEGETLGFGDFLELAYGRNSVESAWSGYLLLEKGIYFTGSVTAGVTPRSMTEANEALAALTAKAREAADRAAFLERVRQGTLLPEDRNAMREVENVALGNAAGSRLMRDLGIEADPVKAHSLLIRTGVWDLFTNPWPMRYGIPLNAPELAFPTELPVEDRLDLTHQQSFAIDDIDSHDPDDAIALADGLLWVHVADPAAVVTPESELDYEAEHRGANLYLPEGISPMLPPAATELFGLGLQEHSPALSFAIRIGEDGEPVLERMALSRIKVTRLDYGGAMALLDQEPLREMQAMLLRFRAFRKAQGALFIDLPEVKVKADPVAREVRIIPLELNEVRELVAHAMLAAGFAVGKWAVANDWTLPFAVQPEPEEALELEPETLPGMFSLRKNCAPSTLGTSPGRHSGLGLEPYVRVTSPLRRYGDLLAHQQLRRAIKGEAPLPSDYLADRIAVSETAAAERRKLERQVNEYWKLVYLAAHPDWTGESVAVHRQDERLTYLIPELAYEYKNRFGGKVVLGESIPIRLQLADPVTMTCRMLVEK